MEVTDETVMVRRHLIDGDGMGDDRRLNMVLKMFVSWVSSTIESPTESQVMLDKIYSQLALCEYSFKKSRLMAEMSSAELENYKKILEQTTADVEKAKQELKECKMKLQEAKTEHRHRIECDTFFNALKELPDRKQSEEKLSQLENELQLLQEKSEKFTKKFELVRKRCGVMLAPILCLKELEGNPDSSIDDNTVDSDNEV